MARLFGFVGNRADLGARVLELETKPLKVVAKGTTLGWGIGFYQAGEVLLRRRPIDERPEIDVAELAKDLRADVLIGHVRTATVGNLRTENTHPFRYRQWLFAHTGTIESFSTLRAPLAEALPQFLQRDVRGETDRELLFHLFLSFLHDAGQLDRPQVDAPAAASALRSCVALVDRLCAEQGKAESRMNVLITNGEYLLALHGGTGMGTRVFAGPRDPERLFRDGGLGRMRLPDFAQSRLTLIPSDFEDNLVPTRWTPVPDPAIVPITRSA